MLFYCPLEGYKERYTLQWSAPRTGWLERNWIKAGVQYTRIDPTANDGGHEPVQTIKTGSVVDGVGRSIYCFNQIKILLRMAERGEIKDSDVILLDDFWTPGLEALPYAFHLLGIRPKVYAFLHAQSVDEFDFTYPMRSWMRPIERGFGEWLDGIFVCCPTLRDLVVFGGIAPANKVHVTGHPFSSEEVMERMPDWYNAVMGTDPDRATGADLVDRFDQPRKNQIVWSSRFDAEKNPMFFLTLAERIVRRFRDHENVKFVVCTSAPKLRSNHTQAIMLLLQLAEKYPGRIVLKEGLSKEEYYATLCESKVQFNSADQDFVAITLLEASVAGCYPVYPYFRSFPETFLWGEAAKYTYNRLDLNDAEDKIVKVLAREDLWTPEAIKERSWIHSRFDVSWIRMLQKMGVVFAPGKVPDLMPDIRLAHKDPYVPGNWLKN